MGQSALYSGSEGWRFHLPPMPQGLLDTLSLDEILDLVALLRGGSGS